MTEHGFLGKPGNKGGEFLSNKIWKILFSDDFKSFTPWIESFFTDFLCKIALL